MPMFDVKYVVLLLLLIGTCDVYAQQVEEVQAEQPSDTVADELEENVAIEYRTKTTIVESGALKTNLLFWATLSPNIGYEFKMGEKSSLDLSMSWNPFTFSENKKWKHLLFQPEYRFWLGEKSKVFEGHFIGPHAHAAIFNVSRLDNPPFSEYMRKHRFEGWLVGAGATYGYRWNFNSGWGLEAAIGLGYAYMQYDRFECRNCGAKLGEDEAKHYFGPTKASLALVYAVNTKKKEQVPVKVPVKTPELKPKELYEPNFGVSYLTPHVETEKVRDEIGQAHLQFKIGSSFIDESFEDNNAELDKLYAVFEQVLANKQLSITDVVMKAYACPIGTYHNNLKLSDDRAASALKKIKSKFPQYTTLFKSSSGRGEDWDGLSTMVAESSMGDKDQVLNIIKNVGVLVGREKQLMEINGGKTYAYMKENMFPQLRRVECEVKFTVRPFAPEELKEMFADHPGYLSLNELYTLANQYDPGSNEFVEVLEAGSKEYGSNDVANTNIAAANLAMGNHEKAKEYLDKIRQQSGGEYWNNMGILAFQMGDKQKAMVYFSRAITVNNNAEAKANLEELKKHMTSIE